MTFLKLAWRNIWRNKRRTLITVASIFFAVSLTTIMRSLLEGVYTNMVRNIAAFSTGYIQVHKKGYWEEKNIENVMQVNRQLEQVLGSNKSITATMPRIETFALATTGQQSAGVMLLGIEPESENKVTHLADRIISGAYLHTNDDGVMIGSGLAKRLQLDAGDTLILMTQGYHAASANYMGVVKGVLKLGSPVLDKVMVYMPLKAAQQLLSLEDQLTGISIMISSTSEMEQVKRELKETVDTAAYEIMDWKELMPELDQMIEADSGGHKITMAILYVVISFGVFSTILMMMAERRREFGIMMAIGMKKHQLAGIVFTETILLLIMGIAMGTLGAWPILEYFYMHPVQLKGELGAIYESYGLEPIIPVSKSPVVFLSQVRAVFIIGLIVLIYPMISIARFGLMKAMRS